MKSGTAIGLLVGGAVLLLATAPRGAVARPGAAAGGSLNPLNWFGSGQAAAGQQVANPFANIFGGGQQQQQQYAPAYQSPTYQPALTPLGYSYAGSGYGADDYAAGYSPLPTPEANGGVGYDYFPVMTPWGGFQDYSQLAPGPQQVAANSSYYNGPAYA